MSNTQYVDRPPRIQPELPTYEVEIPAPPRDDQDPPPIWQSMIPLITIISYLLVSMTGQGSNIAFLLPMALSVFISSGLAVYTAVTTNRKRAALKKAYANKLIDMRREMVNAHNRQRTFYEYNYPSPEIVLQMRGSKADNRGGSRLWERRSADVDFGVIRLGNGTRPSTVNYKVKGSTSENELTAEMQDAQRLETDSHFVTDVPLTLALYKQPEKTSKKDKKEESKDGENAAPDLTIVDGLHAVGISGTQQDIYELIRPIVAQFTGFHSPSDTSLFILGMHDTAPHWDWAFTLPHVSFNPTKGQTRIYFEDHERINAPVTGTIEAIHVKMKEVVKPGQTVATIRDERTGRSIPVTASISGRVQEFGRTLSADDTLKIIDSGHTVQAGTLLIRLEEFELTLQQLEEEIDPRRENQRRFGKQRKREVAGVSRFWKEKIWVELDRRARRLRDKKDDDNLIITLPFMLLIVDLTAAKPHAPHDQNPLKASWLDDLESEAAISLLMEQGAQLGAAVIFLVPERSKIPSGCQGIVELTRDADGIMKFLYAETGVNTTRYVGTADTVIHTDPLRKFATSLAEWEVRRSYGADIPRSSGLLPLYDTDTIAGLRIEERWEESKEPRRADWPKMPLGIMAGQEPRNLHFFADADGVHGMIAGSTGSGKSELLMTIILSLAAKYDPSMVNFVLIDFKGGAAFEPFRELPHVVDLVTNLGANAVARMFAAINAELNRRQRVNQDNDVKDIIRYRKAGLHLDRNDNYPHLFIIIDEFAEMISNNPEYKAQLDSITRLGRALGVSLILAAQRPTGVTDQMRANIKFRICLRVETREESSELLRMPDASYLPSIPGRGYLQVGSESLELIQVAYTGEPYTKEDYSPLERYDVRDIIWESDLGKEEDEPAYDVMVRRMQILSAKEYGTDPDKRPWRKPWPSPLPAYLSLDQTENLETSYIVGDDFDFISETLEENQPFSLCPEIHQWYTTRTEWREIDWANRAMRANIGFMDDAANAVLRTLRIDFMIGHFLILGASGWGKSIFLRTVMTSLVATHAPDALNLYILDFGNRSQQVFEDLPHTGAYIVAHERERVERLLRKIEQIIEERKEIISAGNVSNYADYNQLEARKRPEGAPEKLPAILVVVDNFAEFRESYESHLDMFSGLVREGLSNGLHFIITGEQSTAVGKLFNLLPERITLKLSDDSEYSSVVGRGARPVDEIAGRGLRRLDRSILELQVAMPLGLDPNDESKSENDRLLEFLNILKKAGDHYPRPPQVLEQEKLVSLRNLLDETRANPVETNAPYVIIGRSDYDLQPTPILLDQKQHFIISGQPSTGKTNALQIFALSLAERYSPDQVALVMVDYQGGMTDYGGTYRLSDLPHVVGQETLNEGIHLHNLAEQLENEFIYTPNRTPREIYVLIDTYEDFDEIASTPEHGDARKRLGDLARRYGKQGLHFVIAGLRNGLSSSDELIRPVSANRYGLAMDTETAESAPFYGSVPRSYTQGELPRGRAFVIVPGKASPVQVALPFKDATQKVPYMDAWIEEIINRGYAPATWPEFHKPLDEGEDGAESNGTGPSRKSAKALTPEQRAQIIERMEIKKEFLPGSLTDSLSGFDDETLLLLAENDEIDVTDILG